MGDKLPSYNSRKTKSFQIVLRSAIWSCCKDTRRYKHPSVFYIAGGQEDKNERKNIQDFHFSQLCDRFFEAFFFR